jgi:hypothetical protein
LAQLHVDKAFASAKHEISTAVLHHFGVSRQFKVAWHQTGTETHFGTPSIRDVTIMPSLSNGVEELRRDQFAKKLKNDVCIRN